jgi:maleate isomerase
MPESIMPPDSPEYGPVMGITVPQANTTVEPEMQALLGSGHTLLTARMNSPSQDSRQRLTDYLDDLARHLGQFDVAPVQVAGFACTGSSYLVGPDEEAARLKSITSACGFPLLSAAHSIRRALAVLGARRIALVSPYPSWLSDAGKAYWKSCGLELTASTGIPAELLDTRNIYKLRTAAVAGILNSLDISGCDAVLLSGTGMPSLRLMAHHTLPVPVLSSNFCLAWAMRCVIQPARHELTLLQEMLAPHAAWRKLIRHPA